MSRRRDQQSADGVMQAAMPYGRVQVITFGAPSDSQAGFAIGCLAHRLDGATGTALYVNEGTAASSTWKALLTAGTNAAATFTAATVTTLTNTAINAAAAAATLTIKANTAAAYSITDATTSVFVVDSRTTLKNISALTITGFPVTVASEAAAHTNPSLNIAAKTVTYSGTTTTTSSFGAMLYLGVPTFTDASVCTLSAASALHINAVAAAGGSLTITASYMVTTSVSDCFLTNAGVWTDHSCFADGKRLVREAASYMVEAIIGKLMPRTWEYREEMHGDDRGRQRVGIVYDELPDELRAPGQATAVAPGLLGSFALAALKVLFDENRLLKERLSKLEGAAA